ncbi:hypothetical protein BBOV_II000570 [Babesia bovis T2Bo]|uniref:HEAT repeat-containing protein 1 n=1 Tax=Babesia bovis TaxID=5865 RepID=A7ASV6_BABBO|nr:hypothetical protein BBOV_II000570 [Babesia bovis T2Bo]EDO06017.1 hypothetical protein BBOV_II000570 [Babesia bovis T2Bo]|eukprot:XP_001609585.1 hypothetical protein [Babesia bovis T2Bo]
MTSLFKQIEALSVRPNKAYSRFRRSYASTEHYNRVVVSESWEYLLGLDPGMVQCEGLFRRCLLDGTSNTASVTDADASDTGWEYKDIDFMTDSEIVDCESTLQLFLDTCTPWLNHEPCQHLINFLIYQYELGSRYGGMLLVALLPIHESSYFAKTVELLVLPEGSDLLYYLSSTVRASNEHSGLADVPRSVIIAATVKSFSNYRRICETVERMVLLRNSGDAYLPLYTVLSLAYLEQHRNQLGDNEIRLFLNTAFSGVKHPEKSGYYSAQLCILTVLFTTVPLTISVQKSVVSALLDPVLTLLSESQVLSFELRLKFKECMLVVLALLHQQKERLETFPSPIVGRLITVLHKFPALVNVFRATIGSSESVDFSRFCKVMTLSVVRLYKHQGNTSPRQDTSVELIGWTIDFFSRLDHSIVYMRVMLYTLIDDLVVFSLSCQQDESLFHWDSASMSISLNPSYSDRLDIYSEFFYRLYLTFPSVVEDVLHRVVQAPDRSPEVLPIFLMICHSIAQGSSVYFSLLVHRCFGKSMQDASPALPSSLDGDNLGPTLLVYADAQLPSSTRLQLYNMVSSVATAEILSLVDRSVLQEFVRSSLADPEISALFCQNQRLISILPADMVGEVLLRHISGLLTGSGLVFQASIVCKMRNKAIVLEMLPFYDRCFEVLHRDHPLSRQLFQCLSLFSEVYNRIPEGQRGHLYHGSYHFMSLLHIIQAHHRQSKPTKANALKSDHDGGSDMSSALPGDPKAGRIPTTLDDICSLYFGNAPNERDYDSTMSLLFSILDFLVQVSSATMYVNTSYGDLSSTAGCSNALLVSRDPQWLNEWMLCYGLYEACELLRSQCPTSSSQSTDDEGSRGISEQAAPSLTPDQIYHLFCITEVVLCYAIKLYRESIMLGDLTYSFTRCCFKLLTQFTLTAPYSFRPDMEITELDATVDTLFSREALLLHTMLGLSSEEFCTLFREAISLTPKSMLGSMSLWLRHYFEFGRLVRSLENSSALGLNCYSNINTSYVEVCPVSKSLKFNGVIDDVIASGPAVLAELLKDIVYTSSIVPSSMPPSSDLGTMRLPFISLIELDSAMKMYARCMDMLSHLVPELLRTKVFSNTCLILDVMTNALEFLVDKNHQVRRAAVSMLSRALQAYVEIPSKHIWRFSSVCGYSLCKDYSKAISKLDCNIKGLEKTVKRFCTALLTNNASLPNVMFVNHFFAQCSKEPMISSLLLYWSAFSGTSVQFNLEVIRHITEGLSSDKFHEFFTSGITGLLGYLQSMDLGTPQDCYRYLLLLISSTASVALSTLQGRHISFGTTICPELFQAVGDLCGRLDQSDIPLAQLRRMVTTCAGIATYPLSQSSFWLLKPEVHNVFLGAFDKVFPCLDAATRKLCLDHITSGYDSVKFGMKPLLAIFPTLQKCNAPLREKFVMAIVDNGCSTSLADTINGIMQHERGTNSWFKITSMMLQRYLSSVDITQEGNATFLFKSVVSLMESILKLLKTEHDSSGTQPLSDLSHIAVLINAIYRRFGSTLDTVDIKLLRKVDNDICRCLRAMCQLDGPMMLDFVHPFLYKMCAVKTYLDAVSDASEATSSISDTKVPHVAHAAGPTGCAAVCQMMMQCFDSDKSDATILRFVELSQVFLAPANSSRKDAMSDAIGLSKSKHCMDLAYEEWLGYSIYSCIYICRLETSSLAITKCLQYLRASRDQGYILSKLLFTAMASCSHEYSNIPSWVPRLDVRSVSLSKHHDTASRYACAYEIYQIVSQALELSQEITHMVIDAESFSNHKSVGYIRYRSTALLLQASAISVLCFKDYPEFAEVATMKKRRKGMMALCAPGAETSDSGTYVPAILKKARGIYNMVYSSNPHVAYSRLTLGAISFFSGVDRDYTEGNYWTDVCNIDFVKQTWVCEYISIVMGAYCKFIGQKTTVDRDILLPSQWSKYSNELVSVLYRLSKILSDFIVACECPVGNKKDSPVASLVATCRKSAWRAVVSISAALSGTHTMNCFSLAISRLDMLQQQKSLSLAHATDFVYSVRMCIVVVLHHPMDQDVDMAAVVLLSQALSKFTIYLVDRHPNNGDLIACVLVLMLLLRKNYGKGTGDELLEAILNIIVFLDAQVPLVERFSLPHSDRIPDDPGLTRVCTQIFQEAVNTSPEKLSKSIVEHQRSAFDHGITTRAVIMLSFYAAISCKYYHLMKLVLAIEYSHVLRAMRDSSRLITLMAISLLYNKVKSKYIADLEKLYFLNVNLLSDFESSSKEHHRKSRKRAGASSDTGSSQSSGDGSTPPDDCINMVSKYLDEAPLRLDLNSAAFAEPELHYGSSTGVKCFEDSVILYAVQFFSKVKSSQVVDILTNHIATLYKGSQSAKSCKVMSLHESTRLLLRVAIATLQEYGAAGAAQFIVPRIYEFLNAVLEMSLDAICTNDKKWNDATVRWKVFTNAVFTLRAIGACVASWDSKQVSVPDMCLNRWLPTLGKAVNAFDHMEGAEVQTWSDTLRDTFVHLVASCSDDADRIENVLSNGLVSSSELCKCQVLGILISLWEKVSFHLGSTVVNVMPVLGELADDESAEVQRLAELLNDKIQTFLNM